MEKAMAFIKNAVVFNAIRKQDTGEMYCKILGDKYKKGTVIMKLHTTLENDTIRKSPKLFTA